MDKVNGAMVPMVKPSLKEIQLQAGKIDLPPLEAEKFFYYYEANGWKVGRNAMKNWHSALAHWKLVWEDRKSSRPVSAPPVFAQIQSAEILLADAQRKLDKCRMWRPNPDLYPKDYARWMVVQANYLQQCQKLRTKLNDLHRQRLAQGELL